MTEEKDFHKLWLTEQLLDRSKTLTELIKRNREAHQILKEKEAELARLKRYLANQDDIRSSNFNLFTNLIVAILSTTIVLWVIQNIFL